MTTSNNIRDAHSGQTALDSLATPLQIQRELNEIHRRLTDNDAAFSRLYADRRALLDEYEAASTRHKDALYAVQLAEQGAAAVGAACDVWGIG